MCALIGSNSLFDVSGVSAFSAQAKVLGITVASKQQIVSGVCDSLDAQMAALKASRARIFGLFAVVGDARCIALAASNAGLMGPGYFWFTTWYVSTQTRQRSNVTRNSHELVHAKIFTGRSWMRRRGAMHLATRCHSI